MPGEVLAHDTNFKDGKMGMLASSWVTVAAGSRRGALGSGKASAGTDGTIILGAALHTAHTDNGDKWMCYRYLREETGTNLRVKGTR